MDTLQIEEELKVSRDEKEILSQKNAVLEESIKGILKENTLLQVDLNVLKTHIKELESLKPRNEPLPQQIILQNRLDFKMQEAEELRKQVEEQNTIILELEKKIQTYEKDIMVYKKKQQEITSLTTVIESLQKENEILKRDKK